VLEWVGEEVGVGVMEEGFGGYPYGVFQSQPQITKEEEKKALEEELKILKEEMKEIEARLAELKGQK
jgi:hypothetical protein